MVELRNEMIQWIHKSEQARPVEGGLTYLLTPKKKKKPSTMSRVCGMLVALIFIVVAVYIGYNAQQMGYQLVMYFAYGIAALCLLLCIGIGTGKVTPSTYMGTLDI
jgi:cobalamin biosynthesis protein CobD/CbiB